MRRAERGRRAARRGRWAETLCVLALVLKGWRIVGRGVKGRRGSGVGEVDIIARRGRVLAFIEVKARPGLDQAAAALSAGQQRRLVRAAERFLALHADFAGHDPRFDAMLVAPWRWPVHIPDAWSQV